MKNAENCGNSRYYNLRQAEIGEIPSELIGIRRRDESVENAQKKVADAHQHQRDRNDGTAQATCSAAPNREAKTDRKSKLRR